MMRSALSLRTYSRKENPKRVEMALKQLTHILGRPAPKFSPRRHSRMGRGSGRILLGLTAPREQRSIVKISYTKNTITRSWAAHGHYLQREHAQEKGRRGCGFNASENAIDIRETLSDWQNADDPHFFKVILSPESGHRLDLQRHVKALMEQVARDVGTSLEWVAIDHHNTDHPHAHLLIRGIDAQGQALVLDPTYIAQGIRQRSQELTTLKLGLRTQREISNARGLQVEKDYVTDLDRSLRYRAHNEVVSFDTPLPLNALSRERRLQEIKRLKYLETLGLAERVGLKVWRLTPDFENTLKAMQVSNDIVKSRAQHGYGVVDLNESLAPIVLTADKPITGQVIGMGLDEELYDRRYLLIDGIDGKVHYVRATDSVVKARDTRHFKDGDLVTLSLETFTPKPVETTSEHEDPADLTSPEPIAYIKVTNHQSLEAMRQAPVSALDIDVINYVRAFQAAPMASIGEPDTLSARYTQALVERFQLLEQAHVFVQTEEGRLKLTDRWRDYLDLAQFQRVTNDLERWRPVTDKKLKDQPLIGHVVLSNERRTLFRDLRGQYYIISMRDLGHARPLREGKPFYIRSNRPPGLEFTKTDGRLYKMLLKIGHYDPVQQRQHLLAQFNQQPDFFLKTEEAIDRFVLAHQRRADTWARWGFFEVTQGRYQPVSDTFSLSGMQAHLDALKAKANLLPAIGLRLTEARLSPNPQRFTLVDKLLSEQGVPPKTERSNLAMQLRQQARLWDVRGIALNEDFEKNARQWLTQCGQLERLSQTLNKPIHQAVHQYSLTHQGTVIAKGVMDNDHQTYLVLQNQSGQLIAFKATEKELRAVDINQTLTLRYQAGLSLTKARQRSVQHELAFETPTHNDIND